VSKSPVAGLYEVNLGSQIIYSDAAGDYVLLGDLVDTKTHKNLTDARLSDLNGSISRACRSRTRSRS
jgi:thiol:disulfide interchange protein DsbC